MKYEFWEEAYNPATDDDGLPVYIMTKDEFLDYYHKLGRDMYAYDAPSPRPLSYYLCDYYLDHVLMKYCPKDMDTLLFMVPAIKEMEDIYYAGHGKLDANGNIIDYNFG